MTRSSYYFLTPPDHLEPGTWQWWLRRAMDVGYSFLGIMGFFYVAGAPMTKAEELPGAIAGAIAIQIYVGYMEWRRARGRPS